MAEIKKPINSGYNVIMGTTSGKRGADVDTWLEWATLWVDVEANCTVIEVYLYSAARVEIETFNNNVAQRGYVDCIEEEEEDDGSERQWYSTAYDFSGNKVNCFGNSKFWVYHNVGGNDVTIKGEWSGPSVYISGGSASGKVTLATVVSACTAPTSFTASPEVGEDGFTLTWSGATGGTSNSIVGYDIQYSLSDDGTTFYGWNDDSVDEIAHPTTSPIYDPISFPRGNYIKYRIRTRGSAGSSYYSGWKESNVVVRNSPPGTPTNPQISKTVAAPGEVISVSWDGSTDPDGNHNGYRLCRSSVNGETGESDRDGYVTISGGTAVSRNVTIPNAPGQSITLVVRAEDRLGAASGWLVLGEVTIAGVVNIFSNGAWGMYQPHIFDSTEKKWKPVMPQIYADGWQGCK